MLVFSIMASITCHVCGQSQQRREAFYRDDKAFCSHPCVRGYVQERVAELHEQEAIERAQDKYRPRIDVGGPRVG
jgi:hypothetical protein